MTSPSPSAERSFAGQVASAGFAVGPVFRLAATDTAAATPAAGTADEIARFHAAIGTAKHELAALMAGLDDDAARTLVEFQIAMLEDETVTDPVGAAVDAGTAAVAAWCREMDAMVADYRAADDPYFRGRASDLADLRDRVTRALTGAAAVVIPRGRIIIADDLSPTQFLETNWAGGGIALTGGSASSHVAMLARARTVPMLVGLDPPANDIAGEVLLDGERGVLTVAPSAASVAAFRARQATARAAADANTAFLAKPAATAAGTAIRTYVNIAGPADLADLDPAYCDGIGLVRTELLFADGIPDEDTQAAAYHEIVDWAAGRPVTIRTFDIGADKPLPGISVPHEANPFLGVRGVRLALRHRDLFLTQLRALCRAAAGGPIKIMIPMVSVPAEMTAARDLLAQARADLAAAATPTGDCPLGMMVEVPAAALTVADFDAEFYSIGSNDLIQYVMAAGRDNTDLAPLTDGLPAAAAALIRRVADHARATGKEASLCGDLAGDPAHVANLLDCGLTVLSVAPSALAATKAAIAKVGAPGDGDG